MCENIIEVDGFKFHRLVELLLWIFFLKVLFDVWVDLCFVFFFVIGFIGSIAFPSALLFLSEVLIIVFLVFALDADAELSALAAALKTQAVFFLAMRFFASAEEQITHAGLVGIDLLHIVHIFAIFLLQQLQETILFLFYLCPALAMQLESASCLKVFVLACDAFRTALANHTDLPWC